MKKALIAVFSLLSFSHVNAQSGADLAKAKNCLICHSVSTKIVGPAYRDVAKKYAGQKNVEQKLVGKVLKGGSGVWGEMPMPPNTQVTPQEATVLVKWILSQK